uniref:DNA primase AEP n=1 Tax=Hucho hucho TaxID=62062 RepID=A0A4W5NBM7_9TELE
MPAADYNQASLPDILPLYYSRLFPFSQYYRWLEYGGVTKNYFQNRDTLNELEKEMQKMNPYKIDIGAVYSHRPKQYNTVKSGSFQALEKELVFDVDMTDYGDFRSCCSAADICPKCWTLMTIVIRILDRALGDVFGFRGVHCWVCDRPEAFCSAPLSGEHHFPQYFLVGQDIVGNKEVADKVLALVPKDVRKDYIFVSLDQRTFLQKVRSLSPCAVANRSLALFMAVLEQWLLPC